MMRQMKVLKPRLPQRNKVLNFLNKKIAAKYQKII